MTFDLLYVKATGENFEILKRNLATGALEEFTEQDARALLEQEAEKERFEKCRHYGKVAAGRLVCLKCGRPLD